MYTTTTPPSSSPSERATPPSWFQSPVRNPHQQHHRQQVHGRGGRGAADLVHHGPYYRSEDEHDIDLAEHEDLHRGVFAGQEEEEDESDDDDGDSGGERAPLLSPRGIPGSQGSHTTAAALSPSTGSSSLLRRNFRGGIRAKRSCTDVFFLGVFIAYWVGMIVLGVYAFTRESNVSFAKYIKDGVDFQGTACGAGRFVYFPDFRKNPDFGFCVDACPETDGVDLVVDLPLLENGKTHRGENGTMELSPVTFKSYATHAWTYVCAPAEVKNEAVMIAQLQDTIGRFVGALGECWEVLIICCGVTFGLAALYLVFLRYCGCFTVFLSTVSIQGILTYGSYRLLVAASSPLYYTNDPAMRSSLQLGAVVMSVGAILFLVFAFAMLPRLILGAAFITHASRALSQLKKLLVVPFMTYGLLILLFWWAIIVTICLFGAGETSSRIATITASQPVTIQVETESFRINTTLRWLFLYHAWGIYWSATFILQIGEMITATAVSVWYFSADDRVTAKKMIRLVDPVAYAIKSTFKFHLGTLALSSAVVSPVAYIRSFFMYLEDKNDYDSNPITEVLAKCCCCCIWIFKSCLKFICKESFYITAIQGTSFYPSAKCTDWARPPAVLVVRGSVFLYGSMKNGSEADRCVRLLRSLCALVAGDDADRVESASHRRVEPDRTRVRAAWEADCVHRHLPHRVVPATRHLVAAASVAGDPVLFLCRGASVHDVDKELTPVFYDVYVRTYVPSRDQIYETTVNMLLMCFTLDENMHGGRGNAAFAPAPLIQSVNNHLRPKWQTVL